MFLYADDPKDTELITNGINSVITEAHRGRENVTIDYTPNDDFTGSFVVEVQVGAESTTEALDCMVNELAVLVQRLSLRGARVNDACRLLLNAVANPIGNPICKVNR